KPRAGHVYVVKASQRARAACHITILSIEEGTFENEPVWVIRFAKGDHTDRPRLLKAQPGGGQYTNIAALALPSTGEEVSSTIQARYAENGRANHADILSEQRRRALDAIGEIKRHAPSGRARKELTWAEKRILHAVPSEVV